MSEPLIICLIALSVNLAGMLLLYSLLAYTLVRLSWRRRGTIAVLATLVIVGFFWILPAMLVFGYNYAETPGSFALWFGNWLVSGFGIAVLGQTTGSIPRQLEDSARLDGCGGLGTFWHVVLPLVGRALGLLAILTLMATLLPLWVVVANPRAGGFLSFGHALSPAAQLGLMLAGSLLPALPLIALFFFGRRLTSAT